MDEGSMLDGFTIKRVGRYDEATLIRGAAGIIGDNELQSDPPADAER
jgi:hypothetical protein